MNPHRRLFSYYPFAQLALAFALGVLTSKLNLGAQLKTLLIGLAAASILAFLFWVMKKQLPAGLLLLLALFLSGATLALVERDGIRARTLRSVFSQRGDLDKPVVITGVLDEPPHFAIDRVYLVVRVESCRIEGADTNASGVVSLLSNFTPLSGEREYRSLDLHYGTRILVKATISRQDQYRNPGVSSIREYLDRKGYDATGIVKNRSDVVRLDERPVFVGLRWLYDWRERVQRQIDRNFPIETAGLLDAALLGNRFNLSKQTAESFRESGTFHVFVISGLHISFVAGLAFVFVRRFTRRRLLQFVVCALVVWSYSLAVGAEISVLRAALMFTFVALGRVVFRSASALNALGAATLVLLIKSPADLFDSSLQLTFCSVLAIVALAWPFLKTCKTVGEWHPTRQSPYPPACPTFFRSLCESLYWSEDSWKAELEHSPHNYQLFKTPVAGWLHRTHLQSLVRFTFNAVVISLSVQIVLLPLQVYYFHRLSVSSVVLNIFTGILLAALILVSLLVLLIVQVSSTLASPFLTLANGIEWTMVHGVSPLQRLGLASIRLPEYSEWSAIIYVAYYLPLIVLLVALARWRPLALPTCRSTFPRLVSHATFLQMILIAILVVHPFSENRADGKLHVDFLDVGQGDAALITMPDGATLLVDGGGRPNFLSRSGAKTPERNDLAFERDTRSVGEMVVAEYLWWRGLDHVDYVLATHADADHIDGLNDVVKSFRVRSALVGRTPGNDAEYVRFRQSLFANHIAAETLQRGDELHFGEVIATVLWPAHSANREAPSRNNDSVVLRLQFGQIIILFTGDIEKEAEAQLLAANTNLQADVVKVPHHGSRTSSTEPFITGTRPKYAIISVGSYSMFGHPHREVVERWEKGGATVMTTGQCGTISVVTDGESLTVTKFVQ